MVSKLLLATQETYLAGEKANADSKDLIRIRDHYNAIKKGLGLHKSPSLHGAFPTDAYSHTPATAGAKQPGLTGQVKEDILSRFGELGIIIKNGTIVLSSSMLDQGEMLDHDDIFKFIDPEGNYNMLELRMNQLAFTICNVPVIYTIGSKQEITIRFVDGKQKVIHDSVIDAETSKKIFTRSGEVTKIELTSTFI